MKRKIRTYLLISLLMLVMRDLMLVFGTLIIHGNISFQGIATLIRERLCAPGDAVRYLQIAREGYVAEGPDAINLVFYPLYPFLIRIFSLGIADQAMAGVVLSRLALCGSGICLYELLCMETEEKNAWFGTVLFSVYPFSMFTVGVYTESLFLLLLLSCMLMIRKDRMIPAGILGFLAALTRVQGMLMVFPAVYHVVAGRLGKEKRPLAWRDAAVLLIPAGFCVYLLINLSLHGDALKFMEFEAGEPWYQTTRWIAENIRTQYENALDFKGLEWIIYWPQIALYFAVIGLLFYGIFRGIRMEYLLFGGVYLGFTYLSGWMISGGRYMLCCFPVYIIVSKMKSRWAATVILCICAALYFVYSLMFLQGYAIM